MQITAKQESLIQTPCDVLVITLFEGEKPSDELDQAFEGLISSYVIEKDGFKGKLNEMYVLPVMGKIPADKLLIVGLGKTPDKVREAAAKTIKKLKALKAKKVCVQIPEDLAQMFVEGAVMGNYSFDKYKSKQEDKHEIESLEISTNQPIDSSQIIGEGVNFARDLVNEPAGVATPSMLADAALSIEGLECKIYEKDEIEKMGMGSFLPVSYGSAQPPKFIHMKYTPSGTPKKKVAVVGKGITFDSGGLNIKPAAGMLTMKSDMSGSAATLGIMKAIAQLKPDVEVHGIVAACENMPGSRAYKQGDVLTAMNGKTIEVDNTDAEGRLTLADALCFAEQQGVDEIIDLATLTGACRVALGDLIAGVMGNDDELVNNLVAAADRGGENFWHLPLLDEYKESLKSTIADMKNSGGRYAGALTAGLFLGEFVKDKKWVHIDIAGPAFIEKEMRGFPKGPTGAGVRALVSYILSI